MPQRNPYGYISGKCPVSQLQAVLKLQNNEDVFSLFRTNMGVLIEKHMDLGFSFAKQQHSLRALEAELEDQYPDLFTTEDSEKRLYFALRFVSYVHAARRYRVSKEKARQNTTTLSTGSTRTTRSRTIKSRTPDLSLPTLLIQEKGSQSISQHQTHSHSCPSYTKPTVITSSSSASCMTDYPHGHRAIYDFLETSLPPMTHLMDIFIEFGCVNGEFLLAISSWSSERIGQVLDAFPSRQNGRKMTEMEKCILRNHFKDYFA